MSLLNEARENAEKLLDVLHDAADGKKPRNYRKRARKDYLKYARSRKHTAQKTIDDKILHLLQYEAVTNPSPCGIMTAPQMSQPQERGSA